MTSPNSPSPTSKSSEAYELWDTESGNMIAYETNPVKMAVAIQELILAGNDASEFALGLSTGNVVRGRAVEMWANAAISLAEQGKI